jgi:TRAP-type mannitol/chloroaromatic compound transport system substrate-binding protein
MKSNLLKIGLAGLLGLGAVGTAQAQTKLDMATPWGGGIMLEFVARGAAANMEMTSNNTIEVEVYPAGTLGKALKVTDTVAKGVAHTSHNWPGYDWGVDKTGIMFGGFAGSMEWDKMMHWMFRGGGKEMMMEWRLDKFNVASIPCGSAPRELFLHSHKAVRNLEDYKGMKVRTAGAWAEIAEKLGASTVILAGAEVYPALERKVVDGIEWGTPTHNIVMGFEKVAKYIIVPGVHQPIAVHECEFTKSVWDKFTDLQKTQLKAAGQLMTWDLYMKLGHDDAPNWMTYVNSKKNEIIDLPQEFKDAAAAATAEWVEEQDKSNVWFNKVWKAQQAYAGLWSQAHRYR